MVVDKPKLEEITFRFTQDTNCLDSKNEFEELIVEVKSSLGIDYDNEGFYILKTEQWSIDDPQEFSTMMQRVKNALTAVLLDNPHK